MNDKARRWVLISGGVTTAAIIGVAAAFLWGGSGSSSGASPTKAKPMAPGIVAQSFVSDISRGNVTNAAQLTDNAHAAEAALKAQKTGMGESTYSARLREASPDSKTFTADVTWKLPNDAPFTYAVEFGMELKNDQWKVRWAPTVLHPQLAEGQHLEFRKSVAEGALLGADGTPLAAGSVPPALLNAIVGEMGDSKGVDGWEVGLASPAGFTALGGKKAEPGEKVTVTINAAAQKSAQAAVDALPKGAAIVAVNPQTTEILAVAQNSALTSNAFIGQYPPGSTFKIVTAAAAMQAGLVQPATAVACPQVATVGTRRVQNLGFGFDSIPFRTAFAKSCNTTFAELGLKLDGSALTATARQFGLGTDYVMTGAETNTGKVPAASGDGLVENSFGQGTVTASPFGMALVAATAASGRAPMPTLVRGKPPQVTTGGSAPPSQAVLAGLRTMMQECVKSGTASALAGYAGLHGKTGTAESAEGSHGWFVGYRNGVAFAVFVHAAGSSDPAVSAAGQFLSGLG